MAKAKTIRKAIEKNSLLAARPRRKSAQTKRAAVTPAKRYLAEGYEDPASAPDVYALRVRGDCLAPAIPDACHILCDKRLPCARGDIVVVYLKPERIKPGGAPSGVKRLHMGPPPG